MAYFTLDELRVASPCSVSWSSMEGDDMARFCGECKKNVYNVSLLTRAEANELIREKEGKLCVRFFQRSDGTILSADCPVGLRTVRRQFLKARVKMTAAMAALFGLLGFSLTSCMRMTATAGTPVVPDSLRVDTTHH